MRIEYAPKHDIMNIQFLEDVEMAESVEIEGIIFDYSKDKRIVSIEILDVGKRITTKSLESIGFTIMKEKSE